MLIFQNAEGVHAHLWNVEGVHGQRKVGNPWSGASATKAYISRWRGFKNLRGFDEKAGCEIIAKPGVHFYTIAHPLTGSPYMLGLQQR